MIARLELLDADDAVRRAQAIAEILSDAFAPGNQRWSAVATREVLVGAGTFVVLGKDGVAIARVVSDEAELLTIAVRGKARRGGLGRALLGKTIAGAWAAGAGRMLLEVASANRAAMALYSAAGFVEIGRRRGYYGSGNCRDDAIVMALCRSESDSG